MMRQGKYEGVFGLRSTLIISRKTANSVGIGDGGFISSD